MPPPPPFFQNEPGHEYAFTNVFDYIIPLPPTLWGNSNEFCLCMCLSVCPTFNISKCTLNNKYFLYVKKIHYSMFTIENKECIIFKVTLFYVLKIPVYYNPWWGNCFRGILFIFLFICFILFNEKIIFINKFLVERKVFQNLCLLYDFLFQY